MFRIGCAGWSVPSAHAAAFPGDGTHLERYSRRFPAVEINSSFYRAHLPRTYGKWAAQVPAGFRFAVKFPRAGTHDNRLQDTGAIVDAFADQVQCLGAALGPVLVQLPPSLAFDEAVARGFFASLRRRIDTPVVCEPRHASWFQPDVEAVWSAFGVSRVAADPARIPEAALVAGAGPVRYWRLHGSPRVYYDAYGDERLSNWAQDIRREADAGHECWVMLDNTTLGHATADALRLQALLASPDQSSR